jgi:hypothetical protein
MLEATGNDSKTATNLFVSLAEVRKNPALFPKLQKTAAPRVHPSERSLK